MNKQTNFRHNISGYLFFNLIVVLLIAWTILSYSFFNIYILLFALFVILIGNWMIYSIYKEGRIISLFVAFNGFGLLYTGFSIIQNIVTDQRIDEYRFYAMLLSFFSIIVFDVAFCLTRRRAVFGAKQYDFRKTNFINYLLIIILIISVCLEIYFLVFRISFSAYLVASRAQKSLMTTGNSVLSLYTFTIPLVGIISLQQCFKYKDRMCAFIAAISLAIVIFNSIISMSRAELISIMLPILFLFEYYNRISKRNIILLLVGSFLLFGVWKSLFSSGRNFLYYDSEFGTWYEICENVLRRELKPLYGKSYLDTLLNLVVPFTNSEPLSVWYVKTFEYNTWIRGGGRGFSAVLEAYMNFRIFGNVIIYTLYGWLLKQAQLNIERNDDRSTIMYMILLISMFQFFRSESYSLWKNMAWFRIYPVLITMWMSTHVRLHISTKTTHIK